ncbi:MAG: fumarylacetoacetate hydrolase family protein [Deltaproteobacteria bacterium]|nr:fumarylacetoacetate hydrolase family protein [Deltaproteobacteria bacterium]MCL5791841.1 fumarylacetoacetate hydrolase family protein [Deltaproteobacteria bacterium]
MRIVRCLVSNRTSYGVLEENEDIHLLLEEPYNGLNYISQRVKMSEVKLLSPVKPSKIVAIGLNYREHAKEFGKTVPEEPLIFLKPPSAVIGNDEEIIYPEMSKRVDYEGELAVVIGRQAFNVSVKNAADYIFGYTIMNDVTARDLQAKDVQYTRAKSFDTFAPIGPWVETELNPQSLYIKTYVNGILHQSGYTSNMIFSIPYLVSFVSNVMSLLPGDIISTGTPPGIGPIRKGDTVEVEVQGIGKLKNRLR